jgi:hypothetical protein
MEKIPIDAEVFQTPRLNGTIMRRWPLLLRRIVPAAIMQKKRVTLFVRI